MKEREAVLVVTPRYADKMDFEKIFGGKVIITKGIKDMVEVKKDEHIRRSEQHSQQQD